MIRIRPVRLMLAAAVLSAAVLGCGGKGEQEGAKQADDEKFRVPDSLIAPKDGFELTRDEYHPDRGGVMANEELELHYPPSKIYEYISAKSFELARNGYRKVMKIVGSPARGTLVLIGARDLDDYRLLTRKEWWYYGVVQGDTIYFEPFDILIKRTIADEGLTQKIAQAALLRRSGGRIPPWLRESVASYIAGEGEILRVQTEEFRREGWRLNPSPEDIDRHITEAVDRGATRISFYAAYRMLSLLLKFATMEDIMIFLDGLSSGSSLDEASTTAFGMDYSALIDRIRLDGK